MAYRTNRWTAGILILAVAAITACAYALQDQATSSAQSPTKTQSKAKPAAGEAAAASEEPRVVVFNIITGPDKPFQLTTAFHVAEDALADGRHVILFFNGEGMQVPLKRFSQELRVGDERPIWLMLSDLQKHGAEIVVPRESMRVLGMAEAEFVQGTQVRNWGGAIFEKMPANSVVFTY